MMAFISSISSLVIFIAVVINIDLTRAEFPDIKQAKLDIKRAPINVEPREYDIEFRDLGESDDIYGKVDIYIAFKPASNPLGFLVKNKFSDGLKSHNALMNDPKPCDRIVLRMDRAIYIYDIVLRGPDSMENLRLGKGKVLEVKEYQQDRDSGTLVIRLKKSLPNKLFGRISIDYFRATMPELYSGTIYDLTNQNERLYHALHMEHFNGHSLVPSLYDPNLRAKIHLTIKQSLDGVANGEVIANMPLEDKPIDDASTNKRVTRFKQSVPMSISSLVFAIGSYKRAEFDPRKVPDQSANSIKVNLFEPTNRPGKGRFAYQFAIRAVKWLDNYLKLEKNSEFAECCKQLQDINLVAAPSSASWNISDGLGIGLINHEFLLLDETISWPEQMIEAALNVAQVVTRQWFGHIVVPKTPDDSWITEGLAYYTALQAVRELEPEYQVDQYVRAHHRRRALRDQYGRRKDAPSSRPHSAEISSARQLRNKDVFDWLRAYVVGSSARFDKTIVELTRKAARNGGSISRADLVNGFAKEKYPSDKLEAIIETLRKADLDRRHSVELTLTSNKLQLAPAYHRSSTATSTNIWPLAARVQFTSSDRLETLVSEVTPLEDGARADKSVIEIDLPHWFYANRGGAQSYALIKVEHEDKQLLPYQQFFYSDELLSRLSKRIEGNHLSALERIDILSQEMDSEPLAFTVNINRLFKLIGYFKHEKDPDVLLELVHAMQFLNHWMKGSLSLLSKQIKTMYAELNGLSVTGRESVSEKRAKSGVALLLIDQLHDAEVIKEAMDLYNKSLGDENKLPSFLARPVYHAVHLGGTLEQKEELTRRARAACWPESELDALISLQIISEGGLLA